MPGACSLTQAVATGSSTNLGDRPWKRDDEIADSKEAPEGQGAPLSDRKREDRVVLYAPVPGPIWQRQCHKRDTPLPPPVRIRSVGSAPAQAAP
jgi:hypothetical protein